MWTAVDGGVINWAAHNESYTLQSAYRVGMLLRRLMLALLTTLTLAACNTGPWNNPYPASDTGKSILYSAFTERPKHLDPVLSYSANEAIFTAQIYEPPLQYHYLRRPYELIPLTARTIPEPFYTDKDGNALPSDAKAERIAYSTYRISIHSGIRYQPHPAFAQDASGRFVYYPIRTDKLKAVDQIADFKESGTRELTAEDYVYEIKRLAHPRLSSPIYGLMSEYIVGLKTYAATLKQAEAEDAKNGFLDLRRYPLEGARVLDRYTYEVKIRGKYPQFIYWLAMPFFGPVPWEADRFYSQPGMAAKNLTLDWYPVGTGPYMLTQNNPNYRMVLAANPNFHDERFPEDGEPEDRGNGNLQDAGKRLPFIREVVFSLEKEAIPYWNKFLQGYYDRSAIGSDSFDQAIRVNARGEPELTPELRERGIELSTTVATSIWYLGFNMLDPTVGGNMEAARKLRQAISLALDYEEFISIFLNGRGIPAQGPIPPGIFGSREGREGINPLVYEWTNGQPRRRSVDEARRLLAEAGYPGGRHARSGEPLVLYFDTMAGGPEDKARLDWFRKQLQKINVQLVVRSTDYNRFQEKMLKGNAQLFEWGWNADYPDAENFLFLLYGPNRKQGQNGENAANYSNPDFDRLFERMKLMANGPERQMVIDEMVTIVRRDAPWVFAYYPKQYGLHHAWVHNTKTNLMANNDLKYRRLEPVLRTESRAVWNRPVLWPLAVLALLFLAAVLPAVLAYRRKENERQRVPLEAQT